MVTFMITGSIDLADGLSLNTGATFDPYALDENNRRISEFNIKNGGGLLRLTSANVSTQYSINNDTFKEDRHKSKSMSLHPVVEDQMIYLEYLKTFQI